MGIQTVICTTTLIHDEAALWFSVGFARELALRGDFSREGYRHAFDAARAAVCTVTERRAGGFEPRFELADPAASASATGRLANGRLAAGEWVLLQPLPP